MHRQGSAFNVSGDERVRIAEQPSARARKLQQDLCARGIWQLVEVVAVHGDHRMMEGVADLHALVDARGELELRQLSPRVVVERHRGLAAVAMELAAARRGRGWRAGPLATLRVGALEGSHKLRHLRAALALADEAVLLEEELAAALAQQVVEAVADRENLALGNVAHRVKADGRAATLADAHHTGSKALVRHHRAQQAEHRTLCTQTTLAGSVRIYMGNATRPARGRPRILGRAFRKRTLGALHAQGKELATALGLQ
mmetsp:Transcript_30607/g.102331  ORF Transcript_30607/g.102331 Transcript_30607/m.102331 type:complete len:258 (+) Transcript_30607:248-1021(+)